MISLPKKYYLVVNDKFELFYRGIIRAFNPYSKYVKATCDKGYTYPRYYTYTPKEGEEGEYILTIAIYDDEGNIIESKDTTLVVINPVKPNRKVNVLCIGDSLTCSGHWAYWGSHRFQDEGEECLGFADTVNVFGKCKKVFDGKEIGVEGYGGWQWKTFCTDTANSPTSSLWVNCKHNKTDADQHSVWVDGDLEWIIETIEENRIKFKRGNNNASTKPNVTGVFKHLKNAVNEEDIVSDDWDFSEGNPFWNKEIDDIDFSNYVKVNDFPIPDYIYILLTWNGQYIPYNKDFSIHNEYATKMIRRIHNDFPLAKIVCMGIQIVCPNGGITACYGANGYYHDWYADAITAFNYNEWLEAFTLRDEFKDYCVYADVKGQFDSEYNMPYKLAKVNRRSDEVERIGINGIHPSTNGYIQIGDIFYRMLVYMLAKYEK